MKEIARSKELLFSFLFISLMVFGIALLIDCKKRILSGGLYPPSLTMILFSFFATIIICFSAILLWKTKHFPYKVIALAITALIPDIWLWYADFKNFRVIPLYINIALWIAIFFVYGILYL